MVLPSIDLIYEKASQFQLTPIKARIMGEELRVDLKNDEPDAIEKFMTLAKDLKRTTFFLDILIYDSELLDEWLINTDDINKDDYEDDFPEIFLKAKEYNKNLHNNATDSPAAIELFICSEGVLYSLSFKTKWYQSLIDPEDVLENICKGFKEKIQKIKESKRKQRENLKERYIELLANDTEFALCSNKKARKSYASAFISKKANNDNVVMMMWEIEGIAEMAWVKIKSKVAALRPS